MAAHAAEFNADLQENWTAEDHPPLDACLERVRKADVLAVIVAHRYGWVPEDEEHNSEGKSITWLECEEAVAHGKHVLAFVVDEGAAWPDKLKDKADLERAGEMDDDEAADALLKATRKRMKGLKAFKQWLGARGLRRTFRTKNELRLEMERALKAWRSRQAAQGAGQRTQEGGPPPIPLAYLAWLRHECESVELLGLEAQGRHPTRLSQVYVPALTPAARPSDALDESADRAEIRDDRPQHDLLLSRLGEDSLYVPGDPGAGKSTFCRWFALVAASDNVPAHPIADPEAYREIYPEPLRDRLPVLVPLREFWQSLPLERGVQRLGRDALVTALGGWLAGRTGAERMPSSTFAALLKAGRALLILDGVDEVPLSDGPEPRRTYPRAGLLAALADGRETWTEAGNRLLVTSRPYGLRAEDMARLGLPEAPLSALEDELQALFIRRWYAAADPDRAEEKAQGLIDHLAERADLAELKRNPMLLTALCVRYGEGRRLPQDQHDLYDKIINNVLFNRYRGEDHERAAVRGRLAAIALGMHTGASIQLTRTTPEAAVSLDEVERILADYAELNPATEAGSTAAAQRRDELLARSGLLIGRGPGKAGFYHFSFQEFLAAEHLARTRREPDWFDTVVAAHAPVPEWRLTLGFLFGRMLERNGEQWALEAADRLLAAQNRAAVSANPAPALLCAHWIELLQRKRLNLGALKDRYATLMLAAIEDEISLQDRFRLALILGLVGDPRLGDPRDPEWRTEGLVEVPAGRYAFQDGHQVIEQPFLIGRYPVTNSQFALFIEDGGYRDRPWWSDEGWAWQEEEEVAAPLYWRDSRFNAPNQPVVGVSYWEVEAYCRWAGGRLPTEREWEAAARGPHGHEYPWGGPWVDEICNTSEAGLGRTSPVGLFPRSRQKALGIEDLAGNVWEWCRGDRRERGASSRGFVFRVLRGGSWFRYPGLARADYRPAAHPDGRGVNDGGFRVLCAAPIR
jgi:formylglycine-generating enzyme required for sulfatase activity